jgi:hypothetical protein
LDGFNSCGGAALALACLLSPDYVWLLAPLVGMSNSQWVRLLIAFILSLFMLLACTIVVLRGSWQDLAHGFLVWLDGGPLHGVPDVGLWWYLGALTFIPLRQPLATALHLLPRLCIPCMAVTFNGFKRPHGMEDDDTSPTRAGGAGRDRGIPSCLCLALCLTVVTATKMQPTVPEVIVSLAFTASQLNEHLLRDSLHVPLAMAAICLGIFCSGPLLSQWLDARQLNPNFLYVATLVVVGGQLLLVYDVVSAILFNAIDRSDHARVFTPTADA